MAPPAVVLVTGAAGFAGQHLLPRLTPLGPVVAWDRAGTARPAMPNVTWASVDLLDRHAVATALGEARPTAIYHLAGMAHVGDSWALAEETFAGNVVGTINLVAALRAANLRPTVLITSSATVYRPSTSALGEDAPIAPNTPYGTSKLAQEMVALRAWRDDGVPVVIARSFNHTGPRQTPAFAAPAFARQLARIEAGLDPPTLRVGNLDAQRDLSDVRDTVRAYQALVSSGRPGGIYNVCAGRAVAMQEVLDALRRHVRVSVTVEQDPARMRPADTPIVLGDRQRLTADTGWTPEISLDATLADLVDYWRTEVRKDAR